MTTPRNQPVAAQRRGLSFGSAAEQYERFRPGYPREVLEAVVEYAGRPVQSSLEVGAGTGKATRLLASRGMSVTALEPDAAMAAVLERTTRGLPVELVVSTFEQYPTTRRFDLVCAAAAWHWTDPATRWARAVDLLLPGGVLALFGRPAELCDPELFAAVEQIESQVLPDEGASVHAWSVEQMSAAEGLADCVRRSFGHVETMTAAQYLGRLGTVSAYRMLSPAALAAALRRIATVLPVTVDVDATVELFLARRS